MTGRTIEAVLWEATPGLMALPGVVGTGQGICEGSPCIKVFVAGAPDETLRRIPATLEGYTVAVEETGEFHARSL